MKSRLPLRPRSPRQSSLLTLGRMSTLTSLLIALIAFQPSLAAEDGAQIYADQCADCHGMAGLGIEGAYEKPLTGDSSTKELAQLIAETMPEGDAEACVGEDAVAVASYIYDSFYGPQAQLRLNPPRRRLARLTATQLRNSLADLYRRFGSSVSNSKDYGLKARYYNRDRKKDGKTELKRVDPQLDFDFGNEAPGDGISATNWAARWTGALKVDVTGRYELIVRSSCSFVMYFGEREREFINNHVQSENRTEFRKSISLTAGQIYPLSIQMDQRKRKTEQPPANISLSWKPPYGPEEIIPANSLLNTDAQPTFALQTRLPPDDRSYGYERGIAVDRQWDEATTGAALEFADRVNAELWPAYRKRHKDKSRKTLRQFLRECVETAFRGPITDELNSLYIDKQLAVTTDDKEAIKRVLLIALKSPRFLYPTLDHDRSVSQRAANRLALTLFDSLPSDQWLRDEATGNQLTDEHRIRDSARRMMSDWRVRAKTRQFLYEWLNLSHISDISKDAKRFPDFDEGIVGELRKSLDDLLDEVVWNDSSDFRQLFLANRAATSETLAKYYGDAWTRHLPNEASEQIASNEDNSPGEEKESEDEEAAIEVSKSNAVSPHMPKTEADPDHMFGVLTHPYLMSGLAYRDSTSPIHRGVFLLRYVLGRTLRPPNEAFTPLSPDLHPDMTTRERVTLQTSPENCQVCHRKINGLGFALENFDAAGRYQSAENGRAIDASGRYTDRAGELIEFDGPAELARYLAASHDVQQAFVNRAFQFYVKQPPAAYGLDTEQRLIDSFRQNQFSIRELLIEIAVVAATELKSSASETHGSGAVLDGVESGDGESNHRESNDG